MFAITPNNKAIDFRTFVFHFNHFFSIHLLFFIIYKNSSHLVWPHKLSTKVKINCDTLYRCRKKNPFRDNTEEWTKRSENRWLVTFIGLKYSLFCFDDSMSFVDDSISFVDDTFNELRITLVVYHFNSSNTQHSPWNCLLKLNRNALLWLHPRINVFERSVLISVFRVMHSEKAFAPPV